MGLLHLWRIDRICRLDGPEFLLVSMPGRSAWERTLDSYRCTAYRTRSGKTLRVVPYPCPLVLKWSRTPGRLIGTRVQPRGDKGSDSWGLPRPSRRQGEVRMKPRPHDGFGGLLERRCRTNLARQDDSRGHVKSIKVHDDRELRRVSPTRLGSVRLRPAYRKSAFGGAKKCPL